MKRVLTALALVPIALYGAFWAPEPVFIAIVAVMAGFCFYEYSGIVAAHGLERPSLFGFVAGVGMLILPDMPGIVVAVLALVLTLRARDLAVFLPSAAALVLGVIYIFGAWRCAILLRGISPAWLFFALSINWVGDIAAYYVGRTLGRHKLAWRVSPAKSWEGALASLVVAVIYAFVFSRWLGSGLTPAGIVALGVFGNAAGQAGDLVESAMKRGAGVKDSGTLLPGHGGWLDRLDSSLFSLPVIYYLQRYWQP